MSIISRNGTEQRDNGLDSLKCICAFLVVCIHAPFPGVCGEYFTALTRIAVPIFFMITGYYYNQTIEKNKSTRQIKKIFILVIEANLFYFVWEGILSIARGMLFHSCRED